MTLLQEQVETLRAENAAEKAAAKQAEIDAATTIYYQILRRRENPQPDDARRLLDAMETVGITAEEYATHTKALDDLHMLRERLLTQDKRDEIEKAYAAVAVTAKVAIGMAVASWFECFPTDFAEDMLTKITPLVPEIYRSDLPRNMAIALKKRVADARQVYDSAMNKHAGAEDRIAELRSRFPGLFPAEASATTASAAAQSDTGDTPTQAADEAA